MKIEIRKALKEDSADIAKLLLTAMEDIFYEFIGEKSPGEALKVLSHFVMLEENQYSFKNCWVAVIDDEIVGAINLYPGEDLHKLRLPILKYIRSNYNPQFNPEDEAEAGELYIDSIGINESLRGKGVGTALLAHVIEHAPKGGNNALGLLVEEENQFAEKLYLKLGFRKVGQKKLVGKKLTHLQYLFDK